MGQEQEASRTASKSRDESSHSDTKQEQQAIPHATTNKSTAAESISQQRRDRQKQQTAVNVTNNKWTAAATFKVNASKHDNK